MHLAKTSLMRKCVAGLLQTRSISAGNVVCVCGGGGGGVEKGIQRLDEVRIKLSTVTVCF